jgi:hypothetical protein
MPAINEGYPICCSVLPFMTFAFEIPPAVHAMLRGGRS